MTTSSLIALSFAIAAIPGTETRTMDIRLADLDGDGQAEIIRAVEGGANEVLERSGGTWTPSSRFRFEEDGSDSEDIAIADLNGDGWLDVVFANEDTMVQQLYFNEGGTRLVPAHVNLVFEARSNTVIAEDFDGDGDADLAFGDSGPVVFLTNDGRGNFEVSREAHPNNSHAVQDLEAGDVDGDGDLDVIVASEGTNRLLINDGHGAFTPRNALLSALPRYEETREADFADLDGDGDLDLYFANVGFRTQNPAGEPDRVLLNDGRGYFSPQDRALPARTMHTLDIDFHDVDNDGDLDGVLAGSFGGGVWILINDGTGQFTEGAQLAGSELDALDTELMPDRLSVYVAGVRSADAILALTPTESP
ncbi:MAG: VCBS repeat-containing protein [Pseudomonadota bacterium]